MFRKNPYVRGGIGLPSVFIAAAWIGIWFLWPAFPREGMATLKPQTGIEFVQLDPDVPALYKSPMLFAQTPLMPWLTREESLSGDGSGAIRLDYAKLLGREAANTEMVATAVRENADGNPRLQAGTGYQPWFRKESVFTPSSARVPVLRVQPSGGLAERGFIMPEIAVEQLKKSGTGWSIELHVEAGEDGIPLYVFLESGSGDKGLDALVLRTVRMGKVLEPGKACEGRLIINYGAP